MGGRVLWRDVERLEYCPESVLRLDCSWEGGVRGEDLFMDSPGFPLTFQSLRFGARV